MPVPDELSEDRKVFPARGLYQHLQSTKSCKYHEATYELAKGLYCDSNGDLRIVFKDYVGNMIDLHHDGKYITPRKKRKKNTLVSKERHVIANNKYIINNIQVSALKYCFGDESLTLTMLS